MSSIRVRNDAAGRRAHADDEDRHAAILRSGDRLRHFAAPRLTVRDQHERTRIARAPRRRSVIDTRRWRRRWPGLARRFRRLLRDLLVFLDQAQPPVDAALDVGVPGRVVLQAKGRLVFQVIEKEERTCWDRASAAPAASRCWRRARAQRDRPPTAATRQCVRRNFIDRCHRLPVTSRTRIDAEPSCRITRSMPAVRSSRHHRDRAGQRDNARRQRQDQAEPEG